MIIIFNVNNGEQFEVAKKDLPKSMDWFKAKKQSEKKGDGWRLPTKEELKIIYNDLHLKNLHDFGNVNYWSLDEDEEDEDFAYGLCFDDGRTYWNNKISEECVRLVRTL